MEKLIWERLRECATECQNFLSTHKEKSEFVRVNELAEDCHDLCMLGIRLLQNKSGIESEYLGLCEQMAKVLSDELRNFWYDEEARKLKQIADLTADECDLTCTS